MRFLLCTSLALCLFGNSFAGTIPPFIKPCSSSDPHLNECVSRVITAVGPRFAEGLPELGIQALDPVHLGRIDIDNPALKIVFTDTVVTGLKGFRLNNFKINTEKRTVIIDFTANVTLKAHYTIDGQVLILPIKGEGPAKIKITNLNILVKYDYDIVLGADGEQHWTVTSYKDSYKMERAFFNFKNLFGGKNKQLSDTTLQFLNTNWQLIMSEIAPPAIKQIIKACVDVVDAFFSRVPAAQLLL